MISDHSSVYAAASGLRLDHYLVTRLPSLSRSRIQDLIKDGHATLNGATVKPGAKLKLGDLVALQEPPPRPSVAQAQEIPLEVLYEDDSLLVINKPAGMVVHPAAGHDDGTLVNALLHHCTALSGIGGEARPGIVHRLDKETSGCIAVAKTDAAHRALARQFAGREVTKIYLAIAAGRFSTAAGCIEERIARHPVHRKKMAVGRDGLGRAARTSWRVVQELGAADQGSVLTLVQCTLHTGRTHQIRVHLQHLGHPLAGDAVYGRRGAFLRQMLHSWRLSFVHPVTDEAVACVAPVPTDFLAAGVPPHLALL